MNVKLVVVQGKPEGKEIPLRTPKFLIGRGTECHLRPNSELVSRHHCLITVGPNDVRVRDLGSTNGTLINGERLSGERPVSDDDLLQVGPLGFRIAMEPASAELIPETLSTIEAIAAASNQTNRRVAKPDSLDQWLTGELAAALPSESDAISADAEAGLATSVERVEGQETRTDIVLPVAPRPAASQPSAQNELDVDAESARQKIKSAKQMIEKTREDLSQATADILRRVMDRRPG